jgi:Fic-DOC domain mobile mystery protein B
MSDAIFDGDDDANTPLTEEEKEGLIPSYITLRSELNEVEQINIAQGSAWALNRKRDVLDEEFLRELHRRMYGEVWKWAGATRKTDKNIGIDVYRIVPELHQLLGDVRYWVDHNTYPPDEIAVRFHHRLVAIHVFPNGNGRHARLAADLLAVQLGQPRFPWGGANLVEPKEARETYVAALRAADDHDIGPLLAFARA